MRTTHEHTPSHVSETSHDTDTTMKQVIYWVIVFLALISVVCVGMIVINWSINNRLF